MEEKRGTFYGVGVGPGDPELITQKAVRILRECPVIAAPQTKNGGMLALSIAEQAVDFSEKTTLPLLFSMERSKEKQDAAHGAAAESIAAYLEKGQDVAMLNLGDVSIYATCGYIMERIKAKGFHTVMVPGVPSFCAVAASLERSLTSINAPLHIIPAGCENLEQLLELPGTKILMKSGKQLPGVVRHLAEKGLLEKAALVEDCGLPTEKICTNLREVHAEAGYFVTVIVKE